MRTVAVTLYTLVELQTAHPRGYAKVRKDWRDLCRRNPDDLSDMVASLLAVVETCGGSLTDWSIGSDSSRLTVDVPERETNSGKMDTTPDLEWFLESVLKPHGYDTTQTPIQFPGLCPFTGYSADDDFLESVYNSLRNGRCLQRALEDTYKICTQYAQDEAESHESEEVMLTNWGDNEYTSNGVESNA